MARIIFLIAVLLMVLAFGTVFRFGSFSRSGVAVTKNVEVAAFDRVRIRGSLEVSGHSCDVCSVKASGDSVAVVNVAKISTLMSQARV